MRNWEDVPRRFYHPTPIRDFYLEPKENSDFGLNSSGLLLKICLFWLWKAAEIKQGHIEHYIFRSMSSSRWKIIIRVTKKLQIAKTCSLLLLLAPWYLIEIVRKSQRWPVGRPYFQKFWPLILPQRYVIPMYEKIYFPEYQSFPTSSSFGKSKLKIALTPL